MPSVSPDGKLIAYVDRDERMGSPAKILVTRFDGGESVKSFDFPPNSENDVVRWTTDGRVLTYVDTSDGVDNIWIRPLEGGMPRQITYFKYDSRGVFDFATDSKQ